MHLEVLDQLNVGICVINKAGNVQLLNKKTQEIFNVTARNIFAKSYTKLIFPFISPKFRDAAKLPLYISLRTGKDLRYRLQFTNHYKQRKRVNCHTSPLRSFDGSLMGALEVYIPEVESETQSKEIELALKKYVSESALKHILATANIQNAITAAKIHLSVMFIDVVGFTTLSEKETPDVVISTLNKFYDVLHPTIKTYKGDIDKYIGDAMLITFNNSEAAVRCATDIILRDLPLINSQLKNDIDSDLEIHVGINSGWVITGELGAKNRKDYTVIGDNVNIASRVQSLTPPNEVWVAGKCFANLGKLQMLFEPAPESLNVKGKRMPVTLYKLVPEKMNLDKRVLVYEENQKHQAELKLRLTRMGVKDITMVENTQQLARETRIKYENMLVGPSAKLQDIPMIQKILAKSGNSKELVIPISENVTAESIAALAKLGIRTVVSMSDKNFDSSLKNAMISQRIENIAGKAPDQEETDESENITPEKNSKFDIEADEEQCSIVIHEDLETSELHSLRIQIENTWRGDYQKRTNVTFQFQLDEAFAKQPDRKSITNILNTILQSEIPLEDWSTEAVSVFSGSEDIQNVIEELQESLHVLLVKKGNN